MRIQDYIFFYVVITLNLFNKAEYNGTGNL